MSCCKEKVLPPLSSKLSLWWFSICLRLSCLLQRTRAAFRRPRVICCCLNSEVSTSSPTNNKYQLLESSDLFYGYPNCFEEHSFCYHSHIKINLMLKKMARGYVLSLIFSVASSDSFYHVANIWHDIVCGMTEQEKAFLLTKGFCGPQRPNRRASYRFHPLHTRYRGQLKVFLILFSTFRSSPSKSNEWRPDPQRRIRHWKVVYWKWYDGNLSEVQNRFLILFINTKVKLENVFSWLMFTSRLIHIFGYPNPIPQTRNCSTDERMLFSYFRSEHAWVDSKLQGRGWKG